MYPHWQSIVRPLLIARDSRSLVEIGAEEGKNTRNLLDYCRERGATLRAIEPAPEFDVEAWTREHAGRFEVHRGPSLDVLPTLEPFDTILIDGDHNWFTVFHELKLIGRRSAELPQPFPLVVLHDIGWPYARRDLYYAPDRIPEAYRHSYARKGMRPGSAALLERGGLNAQLCNALQENTPRNGVLTAVEDFLRESDQAFRFLKLPGYAGLGILCPAQLEEQSVDLAEFLKTWDLPPAVQQFYEQLDQNRSQLRINLMERRPSEEPAMSQSGRGEQGAAERRPALALVGAEATKVGAPKGRQRPSANGPDRLERRRPASGGGGEGGPEEPLGSSAPAADPRAFPGPNVAIRSTTTMGSW